jgi:hypothetical protein
MTTPNMPNLGNVAASGSQFKHNIFATIQKKASGIARRASRPGPAAPATPTTNTPSPTPSQPTGNLKANSVNAGRYRRQQRAQAAQTARNTPPAAPPTANTVRAELPEWGDPRPDRRSVWYRIYKERRD